MRRTAMYHFGMEVVQSIENGGNRRLFEVFEIVVGYICPHYARGVGLHFEGSSPDDSCHELCSIQQLELAAI